MSAAEDRETLARWRLVLGKYAKPKMPSCLSDDQERMAAALELYGGPHCLDQKNAFLSYTLDPSFGLFLRHSVSPR
jgi:hypothetical protein